MPDSEMFDYEMYLAVITRTIESHELSAKVTEVVIEASPGPVEKYVNMTLSDEIRNLLAGSPYWLKEFEPMYDHTRIVIARR